MSAKDKRSSISLSDKYKMIEAIRDGRHHDSVAKEFGYSRSTISGIWKKKEVILRAYEEHRPQAKRLRPSCNDAVDRALFTWYRAQVNAGQPLTGPALRKKALQIARDRGDEGFTCSVGWLDRFKVRHGISLHKKTERGDPENERSNFEHKFWPKVRSGFEDRDIFAVKETGLFFRARPDAFSDYNGKVCDRGERAEERLTVALCANMTGTEKRRLLVVGHKRVAGTATASLPVEYRANRKCWVDMKISSEELKVWDRELGEESRRILLLVRYSPAFRSFGELVNVRLGYLPSGPGHPLDPALFSFKLSYRKYVLKHFYEERSSSLDVEDSIKMLCKAWETVPKRDIIRGFRALSVKSETPGTEVGCLLTEWISRKPFAESLPECDLKGYVDFDSNLVTSVHFTSDAADSREALDWSDEERDGDDTKAVGDDKSVPSPRQALTITRQLYGFLSQCPHTASTLRAILSVEIAVENILAKST